MRNAPAVLLEAAECQWLAGLHCDRPEIDLAFAREDVLDDVVVTSGHPGRCNQEIRCQAFVYLGRKLFDGVLRNTKHHWYSAVAADERGNAVSIAVVNAGDGAAWKGSSVSSKGTIASAPAGTGAPVIMRTAAPGSTVRSKV